MNIIEQFFKGSLYPMEDFGYSDNPDWEKLQEQVEKLEDRLFSRFSEEDKARYKEIMDVRLQADFLEIMRAYVYGFKMGSRMIIDVYSDD